MITTHGQMRNILFVLGGVTAFIALIHAMAGMWGEVFVAFAIFIWCCFVATIAHIQHRRIIPIRIVAE